MTLTVLLIFLIVSALVSVVIWGLVAIMGRFAPAPTPAPVPARAAAPAASGPAVGPAGPLTSAGHPAWHVAAISAAVAAIYDDQAVVVHIEPARTGGAPSGWASEGRFAQHSSHNVGHGPR